jgi:hypothetical protein
MTQEYQLKFKTAADILERERDSTIKEWLTRVNLVAELTDIPLSDAHRTSHLPKLFEDLLYRFDVTGMPIRSFPTPQPRTATCGLCRATLLPC